MPATSHSPEKGTISIGLAREALLEARRRGLDCRGLLARCGLSEADLAAAGGRVGAQAYARLWAGLADLMDDEFFGMDAHPLRRGGFRLMCQAAIGAGDLRQAIGRMFAFLRCVQDGMHGELRREGELARLVLHEPDGPPRRAFAYATWLMLVHGLSCWLVGRRVPLLRVEFRCPMPAQADEVGDYRTRFCADLQFDRPCTQVTMAAADLELKIVQREAALSTFLRAAPANLLVRYRNEASLALRVRRELRRLPPGEWPNIEAMAASLRLSTATLQRRLQSEGLSYQGLKDALRRDDAKELLRDTRLTTTDIAERLGFEEPSAFHRAFRKWTGTSPGAWRRVAGTGS